MWLKHAFQFRSPKRFTSRKIRFVDREFQLRYTFLLVGAAAIGIIVLIGPLYYFLDQNYDIFFNLAYDKSPELIEHLERERSGFTALLLTVSICLIVFFFMLGMRLTSGMVGP